MLISDHSSNGTWITSSSGERIKLEKGKPTFLREGDVILLTRSTEANPEVISFKYCSCPFPRITKNNQGEALHQGSGGMLECQAENITKGDQANTRIHLKRQHGPYGQESSPRKVRFKVQIEESIDNYNPFIDSRVKEEERSTEGQDDCAGSVTGKGSVAVKELNDTTLYIDETTAFNNDDQGITHTTTPFSHFSAPPSSTSSVSELPKICRNDKKHDSLLEKEPTKCDAFGQTSECNAAEYDSVHYDKCVHCGKWFPHVTLSLHEAVCEGQSQEAKSQDHVSLSSLPLGDCSFSGETMSKIQRLEKCSLDEVQGDIGVSDEVRVPDVTGQINKDESDPKNIQDETFEEKNIETVTALTSAFCDLPDKSTESDIITTSTVISCESRDKMEGKTVTKISNSSPEQRQLLLRSHNEDNGFTSPHQCEPTISREESKERCTFCSKVLPVSELIVHASECSRMSAVPRTDSDTEDMREACPYCGIYFEVLYLVEHVTRCSNVSRLKAEEVSLKDSSPSSSPVTGAADCVDDPSLGDRELCPKCRREFPVLELLNHADECKEDPLSASSDVESSLEDAKDLVGPMASDGDKGVENVVDNDSKDGIGREVCELESCDNLDRDKNKPDGHVLSSDATCDDKGDRIAEADHELDRGSASDDVNRDEDREGEDGDADDDYKEKDVDDDESSRGDTDDGDVTRGDSYYEDDSHSDKSSISYTNDEDSKSDKEDDKTEEYSTHANRYLENKGSCGVDAYVEAVPYSEASGSNDEFELCPNCFQIFHLSRLVEHASNCVGDVSAVSKAVEMATATVFKESPLFNPSTESTIAVFSDCHFCGVRLPVDVISEHYPRCEKLHLQRTTSEGSGGIEKRDVTKDPMSPKPFVSRATDALLLTKRNLKGSGDENEGLPEHVLRIDNLSTRRTVKGERTVKRLTNSTKTSDKSSKSSKSKAAKLQDADDGDDREGGESKVSLKKTTSSLDSYHDCEEQCMHCLKMFAVSVLVEHACNCASRYEVRYFYENVP